MATLSRRVSAAFLAALLASAAPSFACSICGCSLSSDWLAQGYPATSGFQTQFRYEYDDAVDVRRGTGSVDPGAITYPVADEVQRETLNRAAWFGFDYVGHGPWGVGAEVPYIDRYHRTVMAGDTAVSESNASGLGDLRVLARYQRFSLKRSLGFQVGLKLPTGRFDQTFAAGPGAEMPLDRGLQLGTGTTDLLAGISYFARPVPSVGAFAQALADQPLYMRDGFVPSASLTVNCGVRYLNASNVTPQLQLNARWDGREHGVQADVPNSGGVRVYLSPGMTVELNRHLNGFAFVQVPVYQRVNGEQLEPRWIASIGLTYRR